MFRTIIGVVVGAAVIGGGYYAWSSSSASPQVPTPSVANDVGQRTASGGASCGNWPAVDPQGLSRVLIAPGSSVPAAFYPGLPIPSQTKYIGASKSNPQPIVLTAADADKGPKGVGMFFFCSDMGAQQVFDYMKANGGVWKVKSPSSSPGVYGLNFDQIVTGGQDYFANVLILDAGGKTLISFALTTFF